MLSPDPGDRRRILDAIQRRGATDPEFRRRLLADPHGALSEALGVHVPRSFRIRFIEKSPDVDALIVLPDLAAGAGSRDAGGEERDGRGEAAGDRALDEDALGAVSGGVDLVGLFGPERSLSIELH